MLRLLGSQRRLCDGFTRRDWLRVGAWAFWACRSKMRCDYRTQRPPSRRLPAAHGTRRPSAARSRAFCCCRMVRRRNRRRSIQSRTRRWRSAASSAPSLPPCRAFRSASICLRTAQVLDRVTVVRSMNHPYPVHSLAYVVSGIPDYSPALETRPQDPKLWPFIGSVVDYVTRPKSGVADAAVPQNMALPWKMNSQGGPQASLVQTGPYAAFLGSSFDPVLTDFDGQANRLVRKIGMGGTEHWIQDPYSSVDANCRFRIAGCEMPSDMTLNRFDGRARCWPNWTRHGGRWTPIAATQSFDRYRQMAYAAISSRGAGRRLGRAAGRPARCARITV